MLATTFCERRRNIDGQVTSVAENGLLLLLFLPLLLLRQLRLLLQLLLDILLRIHSFLWLRFHSV